MPAPCPAPLQIEQWNELRESGECLLLPLQVPGDLHSIFAHPQTRTCCSNPYLLNAIPAGGWYGKY